MPVPTAADAPDRQARAARPRLTRRRFVARLAALATLAATGLLAPRRRTSASPGEPTAPSRASDGSASLVADLNAVAATLVPADVTPGMEPDDVARWLESRSAGEPRARERLERTMASIAPVLAAIAGHPARFAELSAAQRERAIERLLGRDRAPEGVGWERDLARPMMAWFYGSGQGYSVVGFRVHAGTLDSCYHPAGGLRMGTDPRTSVTDAGGRVHGVPNLFVSGTALFPSIATANPTLTMMALAVRVARSIRDRGARGEL